MSLSAALFKETRDLVFYSDKLTNALLDMWRHKGNLPTADRELGFDEWLNRMIDHLCDMCKTDDPYQIRAGLWVNAVHVDLAHSLAESASASGFESDTNCYVEDGMVYASVWIRGDAHSVLEQAKKIEGSFSVNGYATDVFADPEDEREVTVNASVDWDAYYGGGACDACIASDDYGKLT